MKSSWENVKTTPPSEIHKLSLQLISLDLFLRNLKIISKVPHELSKPPSLTPDVHPKSKVWGEFELIFTLFSLQVIIMRFWIELDLIFAIFFMQVIIMVFWIELDIISTMCCVQVITMAPKMVLHALQKCVAKTPKMVLSTSASTDSRHLNGLNF